VKTPEQMVEELKQARRTMPRVTKKQAIKQAKRLMAIKEAAKQRIGPNRYTDCIGGDTCKLTIEQINP
jgi:hypothetical protein